MLTKRPSRVFSNTTVQKHQFFGVQPSLSADYGFGHLIQRVDSLEQTLMLGKAESRRRRGPQRIRWLGGITDSMYMSLNKL